MPVLTYNKNDIRQRIQRLSHKRRISFGAARCERLVGNYVSFKNNTGWGNDAPLRQAIDRIWSFAMGEVIISDEVVGLIELCESVTPDSDDFESLFTASAQDAVFAICGVLDYLLDGDIEKLVLSSSYPIDSVDLYVQETEGLPVDAPDLDERIRGHNLMQQEIKLQYNDLLSLELGGSTAELRKRSLEIVKSNLGQ